MLYLLALLVGVVAGLRAFTPLAAVSWGAYAGWIDLGGSWLSFLASPWALGITIALAVAELIGDQLPSTPSRKVPVQFGTRLLIGALCGMAIGHAAGIPIPGALAGLAGGFIGTVGGAAARARLAAAFGSDRPAALLEDLVAIGGALAIVAAA